MYALDKLALKLRKFRLGKAYRHLAHYHPDFQLTRSGSTHEIRWRGQSVGSIKSYQQLKSTYSGTCFIVGSGPSLQALDIRRIAACDAITLNGAVLKYTQAGLAPRHHLMMDRHAFTNHLDYATSAMAAGANCFFPYLGFSRLCEKTQETVLAPNLYLIESIDKKYDAPRLGPEAFFERYSRKPGIYMSADHPTRRGTIGFNPGQDDGFFTSNTVAVTALQLACYLGYRRIFLLGLELGATGHTHFNEPACAAPNTLMKDYDPDIKVCFDLAQQAARDHGFKLYNLTPHSMLSAELVPRLSLDEALALVHEAALPQTS